MNLEQQALELADLRRRSSAALESDNFEEWLDLIGQEIGAVERLQEALLEGSVHVIQDPEARKVLAGIDLAEIEDIGAAGERLLYSWFAPQDYAIGLSRVDALISPVSIPETLRQFVEEARQCYAFQQSCAVYSLSRTILETAVNDICVRIGRMPKHVLQEDHFRDWTFSRRLGLLTGGDQHTRIYDHYKLLCRLVHGGTTVTWGEALTSLVEALGLVRKLYSIHQHAIRKA